MRPELLNPLFAEITALQGVGPALAKPLARLHLNRARDVVYHFPSHWQHRQRVDRLDDAQSGSTIILPVTVVDYRGGGSPRAPFRVLASDAAGDIVSLVYFGRTSGWARKQLPIGSHRVISGKMEIYGQERQIIHPDHVVLPDESHAIATHEPVYPLAEGLGNKRMQDLVAQALERTPDLPEWIDPGLLAKKGWAGWRSALSAIHGDPRAKGTDRLAYDELLANQLALQLMRAANDRRRAPPIIGDGRLVDALKLPFAMTGAQARSVQEIEADMAQPHPMLRLLQGDVGAGKTLVALMALLRAVEAGFQGAMLAPTEILARQHFANLAALLSGVPANLAILTGRDKGKVRESTLMGLADGSIDILVGTHAIFQDAVQYRRLGLVIIDEQHRFGVSQRLMLARKAESNPHLLAMTATPIPRTLTLALYGEMDVSRLDEMPPGRTPVDTRVLSSERLDEVIEALGRHIDNGGQAFWVCPLVEESEHSDLAAAEERARDLQLRFGDKVGLVHGRMKGDEKDRVMDAFQRGLTQVLVATTVIEVGVDVPNASLMIIEGADRFGLAQLHQLRGRVGRGAAKSVCLLLRSAQISETARARLALMRATNDGFLIAEEDLRLRGGGELLGTRQSGEEGFSVATAEQASAMLETAQDDAQLLLQRDGGLSGPRGQAARYLLYLFERESAVATLRSG